MSANGPIPLWLGLLPSWCYRIGIDAVNRRYDRGKSVVTLDRPVISIGNLSVGGTGKTPLSIAVLRWLFSAGHRPALAMRGYGNSDGRQSDEALLYAREFPELDIVARPQRLEGLFELFASEVGESVDCVLLDDGFQHRRIARQFDIVLIDARNPPSSDRLLPAGWLREPFSSVRRAHAVVVTHAQSKAQVSEIRVAVESLGINPLVASCRHVWSSLSVHQSGTVSSSVVEALRGKNIVATCAIGRPQAFTDRLAQLANVRASLVLRDHDPYAPISVQRLAKLARDHRVDAIVCTAKDWSKLSCVAPETWPCPIIVPQLELQFDSGESELRSRVLEIAGTPVD